MRFQLNPRHAKLIREHAFKVLDALTHEDLVKACNEFHAAIGLADAEVTLDGLLSRK